MREFKKAFLFACFAMPLMYTLDILNHVETSGYYLSGLPEWTMWFFIKIPAYIGLFNIANHITEEKKVDSGK